VAASAGRRPRRARKSSSSRCSSRSRPRKSSCRCARSSIAIALRSEAGSAPGPPEPAASPAQRYVNVALEDQAADTILQAGSWYTLALDVDVGQRAEALTAAPFADESLFPEGVDETAVTVQLNSADFDIPDPIRPLRVPRSGKSRNKARFEISPRHEGASSLTADAAQGRQFPAEHRDHLRGRRHDAGACRDDRARPAGLRPPRRFGRAMSA
jgi:hypothetical protein